MALQTDKSWECDLSSSLETLLPELWDEIYGYLTAADLINCTRASQFWRNQFHLPILLFKQAIPSIFKYLEVNDILNCRKVCASWKVEMDNFLHDHPCHYMISEHPYRDDSDQRGIRFLQSFNYKYVFPLSRIPWGRDFSDHMKEYDGQNPLLTKTIFIDYNQFGSEGYCKENETWAGIDSLLERYGSYVWHFQLTVYCNHRFDWFYTKFQRCLSLMPKLKTVHLLFNGGDQYYSDEFKQNLVELTQTHPLPSLVYLVKFHCLCFPKIILDHALNKYGHIEILHMERGVYSPSDCTDYDFDGSISLPKLKELALPLHSIRDLVQINKLESALDTLTLVNYNPTEVDLPAVFRLVSRSNCGKKFLRRFHLSLPELSPSNLEPKGLQLELPHLETLILSAVSCSYFHDFDFVSSLPKLKELKFIFDCLADEIVDEEKDNERINGEVVQMTGYFNKLYESNVWQMLPKLQTVLLRRKLEIWQYQVYKYNRNEYLKIPMMK